MKKLFFVIAGIVSLFALSAVIAAAQESSFSDIAGHRYQTAIEFIQSRAIVKGYADGTFRPNNTMNRAELLTIIVGSKYKNLPFKDCFTDVKRTEWYAAFVCKGKELGIVAGYGDGSFQPGRTVNFVEALIMLQRGYNVDVATNVGSAWYEGSVRSASSLNIIPLDVSAFDMPFTRAHMAELITRLIRQQDNSLEAYLGSKSEVRHTFEKIAANQPIETASQGKVRRLGQKTAEEDSGGQDSGVQGPTGTARPAETLNNPRAADAGGAGSTDASRVHRVGLLGLNRFPAAGQNFTDPVFGTTLRRLTNERDGNEFAIHDYSQLQAFSSDNEFILVSDAEGYHVRRVRDGSVVNRFRNINVPRWQPAEPHTLIFIDSNEDETVRVQYGNADTGEVRTVFTFPSNYLRIRGNQSFDELSDDGRFMAGMAQTTGDNNMFFSLDLVNKRLLAQINLNGLYAAGGPCRPDPQYGEVEPDWVGVTPLGTYLVVQWAAGDQRCSGQEAFDINSGAYKGRLYFGKQHGDWAVTNDGKEVFVTNIEDQPNIGLHFPPNGGANPQLLLEVPWGAIGHISCRGPRGMCLVTGDETNGVLHNELYLVYFDGSVRRLAHHRSSVCGYWAQPRATISRDGQYVAFDSDLGAETGISDSCGGAGGFEDEDNLGGGDVFLMILPPSALQSPRNAAAVRDAVGGGGDTGGDEADVEETGGTQAAPVVTVKLGTKGPAPTSTYTLKSGEEVNFFEAEAQYGDLVLTHTIGGDDLCRGEDFVVYDFYVKKTGETQFTHVGHHEGPDAGGFIQKHAMESSGCQKGNFIYQLDGAGTAVVCITNAKNKAQQYCATATF